ncbi:MAG: dockerin type I repeat-containing protein [candidate division Zixibacteria bacterium]
MTGRLRQLFVFIPTIFIFFNITALAQIEYADDAGEGFCSEETIISLFPNTDTTIIVNMFNSGQFDNGFSIFIDYVNGSDWITPSVTTSSIPAGGEAYPVEFGITVPPGTQEGMTLEADISITHLGKNSPREFPICLYVKHLTDYEDDAGDGIGLCYSDEMLTAAPGESVYDTVRAFNPGMLDNNFNISMYYEQGDGWITANPSSGMILAGGMDTLDIEFIFTAPTDVGDPVTIEAMISINHEGTSSPRQIPVCFTVASEFYFPQHADLATTCKQIRVFNTGRLSGKTPDYSMDYIEDCDTFGNADARTYLYDGSPVIAWDDGEGIKVCTDFLSDSEFGSRGFRAMSNLSVDDTSDPDYIKATGDFTTFDSSINFTVEYYIPQGDTACEFIVQKLYITSASGTKNNVLIGYAWDWNVPSDTGSDNNSLADEARQLLYMQGEEADDDGEDDQIAECGVCWQSDDRYAGVRFFPTLDVTTPKNAMTLDNATWVSKSGPYGNDAPLPDGPIYDLMLTTEGFVPWESATGSEDSVYVDLTMLATFGEFDLTETEPIEIAFAMITGRTGETDFLAEVDKALDWASPWPPPPRPYCDSPGDPNLDGQSNVGDAVYLINFVFKGGPGPEIYCHSGAYGNGDANGDCSVNVGDAVYIINHVFKGGPVPWCNNSECSPHHQDDCR